MFTTWSHGMKQATKVLEKFESFCNPRKNTIYGRYVISSQNQDNGESIDHYVTALKNLASTCEFGALKESFICDWFVFGIQDSSVRERLTDVKLKLQFNKSGHPNSLKSN